MYGKRFLSNLMKRALRNVNKAYEIISSYWLIMHNWFGEHLVIYCLSVCVSPLFFGNTTQKKKLWPPKRSFVIIFFQLYSPRFDTLRVIYAWTMNTFFLDGPTDFPFASPRFISTVNWIFFQSLIKASLLSLLHWSFNDVWCMCNVYGCVGFEMKFIHEKIISHLNAFWVVKRKSKRTKKNCDHRNKY